MRMVYFFVDPGTLLVYFFLQVKADSQFGFPYDIRYLTESSGVSYHLHSFTNPDKPEATIQIHRIIAFSIPI